MSDEIVGWFLVGPMTAVCIKDAPSGKVAREAVDAWVASVLPIQADQKDRGVCVVCGEGL